MSKVHGQDTGLERILRSQLHKRGLRFRKNVTSLPGSPDIVLAKHRAVIFVHGCFWHGHSPCRLGRLPSTRRAFWEQKMFANLQRDARKIAQLLEGGWRVAVVWGCALSNAESVSRTTLELENWITSEEKRCEIPNDVGNRKDTLAG